MADATSFQVFTPDGRYAGTVKVRPNGQCEAVLPRAVSLGLFNARDAAVRAIAQAGEAQQ